MNDFLTVGQLITCINSALTSEPSLRNCAVLGEVSALQVREPHIYFQLKDTEGCIDCALFGYKRQSFVPKAGDKIIAIGTPDVYRVNGKLSFKIVKISLFGIGELLKKIEELKQTLRAEGIFAEEHKKTLPKYALNIALVTGKEGSVLQDMYSTFRRYNDCQQLTVIPTRVQGVTAENDIVNALLKADKGGFDAVILARGGGSFEDLMPFNSEKVARTLYAMRTPVVSAIGHETDNPISDYAADLRALTPTAAAELLAFNADELREAIFSLLEFCKDNSKEKLDEISSQIAASLNTVFHITKSKLDKKDYELSSKLSAIREKTRNKVTAAEHKIQLLCEKVSALNPMSVLQRGFFAVKKNGKDITGVAALKTGDEINIVARDGEKAAIIK